MRIHLAESSFTNLPERLYLPQPKNKPQHEHFVF